MKKDTIQIDSNKLNTADEGEYNHIDVTEVASEFFKQANIIFPDETKSINIRIKQSTIDLFKLQSKHYQSLINAVLDAYATNVIKKNEVL